MFQDKLRMLIEEYNVDNEMDVNSDYLASYMRNNLIELQNFLSVIREDEKCKMKEN